MKITIIGAGNVASHLATALKAAGHEICGVVSRGYDSAVTLAQMVGAKAYRSASELSSDGDLVLICTNDTAVAEVAAELPAGMWIVAHTSGSVPIEVLTKYHLKTGVFYPLQTFSKNVSVDLRKVPFFIEGNTPKVAEVLKAIAGDISEKVYDADSDVRKYLHVAGVMASNFPVMLMEMCRQVLERQGLPLDTVKPLIEAAVEKAMAVGPIDAMTGPARRGDIATVSKHLDLLRQSESIAADTYKVLSNAILNRFHPQMQVE